MTTWRRDCACGALVTADPLDPLPGVAYHNAQEPHRSYSARTSLLSPVACPTATPVLVDVSGNTVVRPARHRRRDPFVWAEAEW